MITKKGVIIIIFIFFEIEITSLSCCGLVVPKTEFNGLPI